MATQFDGLPYYDYVPPSDVLEQSTTWQVKVNGTDVDSVGTLAEIVTKLMTTHRILGKSPSPSGAPLYLINSSAIGVVVEIKNTTNATWNDGGDTITLTLGPIDHARVLLWPKNQTVTSHANDAFVNKKPTEYLGNRYVVAVDGVEYFDRDLTSEGGGISDIINKNMALGELIEITSPFAGQSLLPGFDPSISLRNKTSRSLNVEIYLDPTTPNTVNDSRNGTYHQVLFGGMGIYINEVDRHGDSFSPEDASAPVTFTTSGMKFTLPPRVA